MASVQKLRRGSPRSRPRSVFARQFQWFLASTSLAGTCIAVSPATAADWLGTVSNSWFLAGNWNPATVPTIADNVTINNGGSPNPATVSAAGATARKIDLGTAAGQSGTLNITGGVLTLQAGVGGAEASIAVGNKGSGTLNISAGGILTSAVSYIALDVGGSSGVATVTGAGSIWNATSIDVGSSGNGTLNILAGGVVNAGILVGSDNGAVGNVLVSGAGSQLNGALAVGRANNGTGTVRYENGATGTGGGITIASAAGSTGTVTFDGTGTSYTSTGSGSIGTLGTGTLNVLNGATVTTSNFSSLGSSAATGNGTALVSGSGSSWSVGNLNIGTVGTGTLTVSSGGKVTTTSALASIATVSLGGSATVTGTGSQWEIVGNPAGSSQAVVGIGSKANTTATLTVSDGGSVSIRNNTSGNNGQNMQLRMGISANSTGSLTVAGANSSFTTPYDVYVAYNAGTTGNITVSNGGALNTGYTVIGSSGTGNAVVTGAGSVWTISDMPNVPGSQPQRLAIASSAASRGTLTITDGGTVNVNATGGSVVLGGAVGSQATLNIGAAAASPASAAGTLNATAVVFGTGATSTVNFNHTSNNYLFTAGIQGTGPGTVNFLSGKTILAGNNTYGGATNISAGATAQFGNGSNVGLISGSVTNNGAMAVNISSFTSYAGAVSGTGTFEKLGTNTLSLTGMNIYTGDTIISGGTLRIGSGGAAGSIAAASNVVNNSILSFNRSDSFTFANLISGTGSVSKDGGAASVVTLTAANTYTGGTSVSAGTLRLGASNRLAATGSLFLSSGGTFDLAGFSQTVGALSGPGRVAIGAGSLTFGNNLDRTFQGTITGNGSFIKQGTGSFTMTANNSAYTGTTTVNNGLLAVNGDLSNSATTVNANGTLGGTGTVGATTVNGTIAPGNSIGTLNVNGPYVQSPGSFYNVEVNAAGQSDLINVTGTASINGGTVRVLAGMGAYNPTTVYTILTSTGARTGTYAGVTSNFAFLDPTLTYDPNNVYLTLIRNSINFASVGGTPNQKSAGGGLAALGMANPVVAAALMLTPDQARTAFDSVSGEIHPSLHSLMLDESALVRDALLGRQRQDPGQSPASASASGFADEENGALAYAKKKRKTNAGVKWPIKAPPPVIAPVYSAWVQGYGNWTQLNGNGNAATLRSTNGGAIGGVDVTLNHNWRFGVATGGGRTDARVDARLSSGTIDTFHLAAYGGGRIGDILFRTGAAYSHHDVATTRTIAFPGFADTAKASYNASTSQVFGEAAYRLKAGALNTEAFATLAHVRVSSDGFTETGGAAALRVADADTSATFTTLGIRAQAPIPAIGPWAATARGSLGWQHAYDRPTPVSLMSFATSPAPFAIAGVPIATDALLVEAGLEALVRYNTVVALFYTGRIAADTSAHAIKANVAVRF